MIQLTLTLKMTTAQVFEMSVTVNNNSPIQNYVQPDNQIQITFGTTPEFKPFTKLVKATVHINFVIFGLFVLIFHHKLTFIFYISCLASGLCSL